MNEKNNFLTILEEQSFFSFNGRINLMSAVNGQLLGYLLFKDGVLIFAQYEKAAGMQAMGKILSTNAEKNLLKYIVEPEITDLAKRNISIDLKQLKDYWYEISSKINELKKLRPPSNIKLQIRPSFIWKGEEMSANEFDLLCIISDFSNVGDIYDQASQLTEFQVTETLTMLRKKDALKVLKRN